MNSGKALTWLTQHIIIAGAKEPYKGNITIQNKHGMLRDLKVFRVQDHHLMFSSLQITFNEKHIAVIWWRLKEARWTGGERCIVFRKRISVEYGFLYLLKPPCFHYTMSHITNYVQIYNVTNIIYWPNPEYVIKCILTRSILYCKLQ